MARYSEAELAAIKQGIDLAALIRSKGIELHKQGKDLKGLCPFHGDSDPSFIVSPDKGLFHCMGCGKGGDAIRFLQEHDGVSFRHAVELLRDGAAEAILGGAKRKKATVPKLPAPVELSADDRDQLRGVVDYYHDRLLQTQPARAYLEKRQLWSEEAATTFRLGYADRTLGLRLPDKNRVAGQALRTQLQKIGLYRDSGHEHFNGCVVVPILSGDGEVQEIYGRKLTDGRSRGRPNHLYLPGPHRGLWNPACLEADEVVLCEAILDALTLWMCGVRNVTAAYGAEGTTAEMLDLFVANRVRKVTIAFDADEAGNRSAAKLAQTLADRGIEPFRARLPLGMDVNDYVRRITARDGHVAAAAAVRDVVASAQWLNRSPQAKPPSTPARARLDDTTPAEPASSCADTPVNESKHSLAAECATEQPSKPAEPPLEQLGEYWLWQVGNRQWRIGGLEKNHTLEVMRLTLRLRYGEQFHVDSIDLLQDVHRRRFVQRAAEETGLEADLIKRDMARLLLKLEQLQEDRLRQALQPAEDTVRDMSAEDEAEALAFLKAPDLVARIDRAFDECGLVGESANRLAAYLACTSRLLARPLAVIVQSTSAAGKSALMEAVLATFPQEAQVKYSAMTGQSLYYLGETDLEHRILAIVEEEGAEKAGYALKLLQSEGELTIASTGKDPKTGRMQTQEYHVHGPVMIFLTTTAVDIDEELQNRCLTLTVDESREQTERIHQLQRHSRTLAGMRLRRRRRRLLKLLRNAQRLLEPVEVVNPFAEQLTFTASRTRTRRDHEKYLSLIDTITLLHQQQRTRHVDEDDGGKTEFVQVALEDVELANRLAPELLGRSLDELPPQTRRLLEEVKALVRETCEKEDIEQQVALFSRRQLCQRLGWSLTQVRVHLARLHDHECVAVRCGRFGSVFRYELLIDCNEPDRSGGVDLVDIVQLRETATTTDNLAG